MKVFIMYLFRYFGTFYLQTAVPKIWAANAKCLLIDFLVLPNEELQRFIILFLHTSCSIALCLASLLRYCTLFSLPFSVLHSV